MPAVADAIRGQYALYESHFGFGMVDVNEIQVLIGFGFTETKENPIKTWLGTR